MTIKNISLAFTGLISSGLVYAAVPTMQTVEIKNTKGDSVGSATITPMVKGVKVVLDLHGLPPGEHALHFHDKGACQGPKFETAGGHFSPSTAKHGFDMDGGPHAGDMSNFFVATDGTAKVEVVNSNVTLAAGPNSLLKSGGTSLVIHEKADDYKSQPAGEAGGRMACGVIK